MTIEKLETWHRIEEDGSGDFYLVPVGLFGDRTLENAVWSEEYEDEKKIREQCIYIGGFSNCVQIRGEYIRD